MYKKDIKNDSNFVSECKKYDLDYHNFKIYKDILILDTKKDDIKVFMDKDYNMFHIYKITPENCDVPLEDEALFYKMWFNRKLLKITVGNTNQSASYKEMVEIYKMVSKNKELYTLYDNDYIKKYEGNDRVKNILFLSFLGKEIKYYFDNAYENLSMGFEYISLDEYITNLIKNLISYIDSYLNADTMFFPSEVIKRSKIVDADLQNKELFTVITYLIKGEGYRLHSDEVLAKIKKL